ncbi:MAG: acetyltransferase [Mesorhizobium sp.]|nr:acetyltransferase [Mesorhizobium sp.]
MNEAVFFATGSAILVDLEESLARRGVRLAAGIRNRPGENWLGGDVPLVPVDAIDAPLLALPFLVPLFTPANRRAAVAEARAAGFRSPMTLVDPTAILPRNCVFGEGTYIGAGTLFGAASTFGDFTFVNRGASIGHHFSGGDYLSVGPGVVIAGQVTVGRDTLIGAGAVVLPEIRIGAACVVGAGALVTRDVPDGATVVGNPARARLAKPDGDPR